jgi:hypothetical protein
MKTVSAYRTIFYVPFIGMRVRIETNMELYLFVTGRMKQVQLVRVHKGHVVAPLMINEYGAFVKCIWQGKDRKRTVPMPLCAPHILHGLPRIESGFPW